MATLINTYGTKLCAAYQILFNDSIKDNVFSEKHIIFIPAAAAGAGAASMWCKNTLLQMQHGCGAHTGMSNKDD